MFLRYPDLRSDFRKVRNPEKPQSGFFPAGCFEVDEESGRDEGVEFVDGES
jgi:hypothetical protein